MHKILVIEDDPLLAKLYSQVLSNGGFEPQVVTNGKEGLERILEGGYALILLDIMLPGLDGLTILQELKSKTPKQPNGPIVVMTNLSGKEVEDNAISSGAIAFIDKTKIKADQIAAKAREWMRI